MLKLVVFDLDGTAFNSDGHTISEANKTAMKKAYDQGAKIVIATGRTIQLCDFVAEEIPFSEYMITATGSAVFKINREGKTSPTFERFDNQIADFPVEIASNLYSKFLEYPIATQVYHGDICYLPAEQKSILYAAHDSFLRSLFDRSFTFVDNLDQIVKTPGTQKFTLSRVEDDIFSTIVDFTKQIPGLNTTTSYRSTIEITTEEGSKGNALKNLAQNLNVELADVLAIGDSDNDISMLQIAGHSFAPANAIEPVKQIVNHIVSDHNQNAVAEAIEIALNSK